MTGTKSQLDDVTGLLQGPPSGLLDCQEGLYSVESENKVRYVERLGFRGFEIPEDGDAAYGLVTF